MFDLQVQNGYRQHTPKSCFYACELKCHKQHLFNGKLKNRLRNTADKVARHSKLYLITVYYNML